MKSFAKKWAVPWIGFSIILLAAASVSQQFVATNIGVDFWTATATEIREKLVASGAEKGGVSDIASYIAYAKLLIAMGVSGFTKPTFVNNWLVKSWTPVFPGLIAMVLRITGEDAYLVKMLGLSIVLWATTLTIFLNLVPFHPNRGIRFACLSVLWFLPNLRYWTVGEGYVLSESISTAFFVLSLALVSDGLLHGRRRSFYMAAAILVVPANLRATFELPLQVVTFGLLAVVLAWSVGKLILALRRRSQRRGWTAVREILRSPEFLTSRTASATIMISALIIVLGTAPWKLFNYANHGVYGFSPAGSHHEWRTHWVPPDLLPEWVRAGNTACMLDLAFCRFVYANQHFLAPRFKHLAIATLVGNPWGWISYRLSRLNWLWIGRPWIPPPDAGFALYIAYLEGMIYISLLALGLWLLASHLMRAASEGQRRKLLLHSAIVLLYLGANAAMFVFVHYEDRYSLPLRLFSLWTPAVVATLSKTRD